MPRYFFHLHDGVDVLDPEGTVLRGHEEAKAQAIMTAGEIVREKGKEFLDESCMTVVGEGRTNRLYLNVQRGMLSLTGRHGRTLVHRRDISG